MGKKNESIPGMVYGSCGPYRILEDGSVWVPADPHYPATYAPGTSGYAYFTGQHDDDEEDYE